MSEYKSVPDKDVPRNVFLSRNWGGDHYVLTFRPPIELDLLRELSDDLKVFTGLGSWCIYFGENESRITRHNDVGGDDGLMRAGEFVCSKLEAKGFCAILPDAESASLPRSENGLYEAAA